MLIKLDTRRDMAMALRLRVNLALIESFLSLVLSASFLNISV